MQVPRSEQGPFHPDRQVQAGPRCDQRAVHVAPVGAGGAASCWGYNGTGQLGDGTSGGDPSLFDVGIDKNTPVQVSGLTNVTAIAGGGAHSLALKSDGTVWAWGLNNDGQLGDNTTTGKRAPVQVKGSGGVGFLTGIIKVKAGKAFSIEAKP